MQQKTIMLFCSDGPHHHYLRHRIGQEFRIAHVVVEPYAAQEQKFLRRRKFRTFLYSRYHTLRRKLLGWDRFRRNYFRINGVPSDGCAPETIVDDINSLRVQELLDEIKPDLSIVMGTSIIHEKLLTKMGLAINIHGGYLPDYRGNHCFFFAVYKGDYEKLGSTIHFVNRKVDNGAIIDILKPPLAVSDNPETLYSKAEKLAVDRLPSIMESILRGEPVAAKEQGIGGRMYRIRDRGPLLDVLYFVKRLFGFISFSKVYR